MRPTRSVVYFAYVGEEGTEAALVQRRLGFMEQQLQWLAALAGPQAMPVLVPYVAPRDWDAAVHGLVARYGFAIDPASVAAERHNSFEYPGFRALKALAEASVPDDLLYYCHSKGIVQLSPAKMGLFRLHTHIGLTADLAPLSADPERTKAGLFPSRWGWSWHNFFWIKASEMARRTVTPSADRYQFEALIGDPADAEGYRRVLPLTDRLPPEARGLPLQPWYRAAETSNPQLDATCARYAAMAAPPEA